MRLLPVSTPCVAERQTAAVKGRSAGRSLGGARACGRVSGESGEGLRPSPRNDRPDFRRGVLPLDRPSAVVPTTVGKRKDDQ